MILYANEEAYEIITFCCLERSGNEKLNSWNQDMYATARMTHKIGKLNFKQRGGMWFIHRRRTRGVWTTYPRSV